MGYNVRGCVESVIRYLATPRTLLGIETHSRIFETWRHILEIFTHEDTFQNFSNIETPSRNFQTNSGNFHTSA